MSDSQGGAGRREVAFRLFAAEYDDADFSYSESDEDRAPNYVVTPTGARVNRLFVVGVLTEVEAVSEDYLRARVVDPTGPFVVYAGQYQPEAMNFLERAEPPQFVAVTGKARTFQPEDSDRVYTSIRPETINEVEADTRDRWVVQAAEQTIERVARAAEAKASGLEGEQLTDALAAHGVDDGLASGIPLALEHYGTTGEYLAAVRELALDAARVVAGERDEVAPFSTNPADGTDEPLERLVERPIDVEAITATAEQEADSPDLSDAPEPDAEPSPTDAEIDDAVASADIEEPADTDESTDVAPESTASADDVTGTDSVEADATEANATEVDATEADATEVDSTGADAKAADTAESDETEADPTDDDLEEFDGEFELDEEEREEIEAEYGTEFQSGSEVDDPGEADIETPTEPPASEEAVEDDEDAGGPDAGSEAEEAADELAGVDESADDEDEAVSESAADVDLDEAVMDAMAALDDGDGADRDAVVAEVVGTTDADPGEVEDAIQEALMDGRCYEPDDETLKAI